MKPWQWYWAYHHVPAVKVNGVWMALDLLGLRPAPRYASSGRGSWSAPGVSCEQRDWDGYQQVWNYWNVVLGSNWEPPADKPSPYCAYNVSPKPFAWRPDQIERAALRRGALRAGDHGGAVRGLPDPARPDAALSAKPAEIPAILSLYDAQTEATLCEWMNQELKICQK